MTNRSKRSSRQAQSVAQMALAIPPATATVLSKRVPLLVAGALDPKKRNRREEHEMVREKIAAGLEAGQGVGMAMLSGGLALTGAWMRALGATAGLAAGAASGKPKRDRRGGLGPWQDVATRTVDLALEVTTQAVRPAHRKVTANARRLAKSKP